MSDWYQIESNQLVIQVTSSGAELKRLFNKIWNKELLWQSDEKIWKRSAPILFPIVGKLINDQYSYNEQEFQMNQHGFARDMEFVCIKSESDELKFLLGTTKETFAKFPFLFNLTVTYKVEENKLSFETEIKNLDQKDMYFSIGWHPAFEVRNLSDAEIEFEKKEAKYFLLNEGKVDLKKSLGFDNIHLSLEKNMFENDALIFPKLKSKWVALNDWKAKEQIKLNLGNHSYLGIWGKENVPFLCMEPWMGLADLVDSSGKIEEKHGIIKLKSKGSFEFSCSLEFNKLVGR